MSNDKQNLSECVCREQLQVDFTLAVRERWKPYNAWQHGHLFNFLIICYNCSDTKTFFTELTNAYSWPSYKLTFLWLLFLTNIASMMVSYTMGISWLYIYITSNTIWGKLYIPPHEALFSALLIGWDCLT